MKLISKSLQTHAHRGEKVNNRVTPVKTFQGNETSSSHHYIEKNDNKFMYFFSDKFKVRVVMISCDDIFQITLTESHFLPTSSLVLKSSQRKLNLLFLLASKFVSNSLRFHWKFFCFHNIFSGNFYIFAVSDEKLFPCLPLSVIS